MGSSSSRFPSFVSPRVDIFSIDTSDGNVEHRQSSEFMKNKFVARPRHSDSRRQGQGRGRTKRKKKMKAKVFNLPTNAINKDVKHVQESQHLLLLIMKNQRTTVPPCRGIDDLGQ